LPVVLGAPPALGHRWVAVIDVERLGPRRAAGRRKDLADLEALGEEP
jgi:hypothetical protein